MSRLDDLRRDQLDAEGQDLWDKVVGTRPGDLISEEGTLVGPFNSFVHAPNVGRRLSALGAVVRFGTSLERRLSEIAMITVGAYWKAEFEWWAHARMAREHGVPDEVVDAIGAGADPPFQADDERAVYTAAHELVQTGRISQPAYDAVAALLGQAAMVEFVTTCGYYTMISFLLNAFGVPLPPGAPLQWPDAAGGGSVTAGPGPYLPAEAAGTAPGRGRLAGRRILVVGAGTRPSPDPDAPPGNGRAIAVLAAREGAAVACADRDAGANARTAELVRAEGGTAAELIANVADAGACGPLAASAAAALGGLDGIVLNVGIGLGRGMTGTTVKQWDTVFAVNTRAHFLIAAAGLEVLEPQSAIVFISSAASITSATGVPAYDASKAALLGICRQTAREGMPRRIRANVVVPSYVDTPLGRLAGDGNAARARQWPFGRQATAWEVAYAVIWLLSGESSYVNAQPLLLDGGQLSFT